MLLTRGITFYLYVIISLIIVFINALRMKDIKSELDEPTLALGAPLSDMRNSLNSSSDTSK